MELLYNLSKTNIVDKVIHKVLARVEEVTLGDVTRQLKHPSHMDKVVLALVLQYRCTSDHSRPGRHMATITSCRNGLLCRCGRDSLLC